ncbi:13297_t:CDS:2, partial [Gigaspora rosea]
VDRIIPSVSPVSLVFDVMLVHGLQNAWVAWLSSHKPNKMGSHG